MGNQEKSIELVMRFPEITGQRKEELGGAFSEAYEVGSESRQKEIDALRDALRWMSGSGDFAPGGKAREGFEKIQHLLVGWVVMETPKPISAEVVAAMRIVMLYCKGRTDCVGCPIEKTCHDSNPGEWEVPD